MTHFSSTASTEKQRLFNSFEQKRLYFSWIQGKCTLNISSVEYTFYCCAVTPLTSYIIMEGAVFLFYFYVYIFFFFIPVVHIETTGKIQT